MSYGHLTAFQNSEKLITEVIDDNYDNDGHYEYGDVNINKDHTDNDDCIAFSNF